MSTEGGPAWFETLESREVYRGYARIRVERVRTPTGEEVEREIVVHDDAVAVVPVTDDGRVLLLRQYRQALRRYMVEVPAGKLDQDGEELEAAARRELAEEIGHEVGRLTHLLSFHNSVGWTTERTHVYLGEELSPCETPEGFVAKAEEADMEVVPMRLQDAVAAARAGELSDAKTLVGLLAAGERLRS